MKKKIFMLIMIIILLISPIVYAHPGKTDSNGGHFNHSTGEYHYHHGYPAHQHPNGVCPYLNGDMLETNNNIFNGTDEDIRRKQELYNRIMSSEPDNSVKVNKSESNADNENESIKNDDEYLRGKVKEWIYNNLVIVFWVIISILEIIKETWNRMTKRI